MTWAWVLIGAVAGGAFFWLRGAAWFEKVTGRGATTARLVWSVAMGVLAGLSWGDVALAAAAGVGLFVGCLAGWYRSLSLGRLPMDRPVFGAYARHAARGLFWTAPAAVAVMTIGWWLEAEWRVAAALLALAGLACVPAYEIGWRLRPAYDARRPEATEIGEMLFGAVIGAAIGAGAL